MHPPVTHLTPFLVTILVEEALKTFSKRCSLNQSILREGWGGGHSTLISTQSVCHRLLHNNCATSHPAAQVESRHTCVSSCPHNPHICDTQALNGKQSGGFLPLVVFALTVMASHVQRGGTQELHPPNPEQASPGSQDI